MTSIYHEKASSDPFERRGMDGRAFVGKQGLAGKLRSFDAFLKTDSDYHSLSLRGGQWTLIVLLLCSLLAINELRDWCKGNESHHFSVQKGVSRQMQMNIDMVVKMPCSTVRINMQDVAGDNVVAAEMLTREPTSWDVWDRKMNMISHEVHEYQALNSDHAWRQHQMDEGQHFGHVFGESRRMPGRKFPNDPRLKRHEREDSCRIYGSLKGNGVAADVHIIARGHGYFEMGEHLDHSTFNFWHIITKLSFGLHYPSLMNPLDKTVAITEDHFYIYQYFLSVVPTIYTRSRVMDPYIHALPSPGTISHSQRKQTVFTSQYAVTAQSHAFGESQQHFRIPGLFLKFNVEPILLIFSAERGSLLCLLVRLVNVVSGVVVAGGWLYWISGWSMVVVGKKRKRAMEGMLGKKTGEEE